MGGDNMPAALGEARQLALPHARDRREGVQQQEGPARAGGGGRACVEIAKSSGGGHAVLCPRNGDGPLFLESPPRKQARRLFTRRAAPAADRGASPAAR